MVLYLECRGDYGCWPSPSPLPTPRRIIKEIKANHETQTPEALARTCFLVRELNTNISAVRALRLPEVWSSGADPHFDCRSCKHTEVLATRSRSTSRSTSNMRSSSSMQVEKPPKPSLLGKWRITLQLLRHGRRRTNDGCSLRSLRIDAVFLLLCTCPLSDNKSFTRICTCTHKAPRLGCNICHHLALRVAHVQAGMRARQELADSVLLCKRCIKQRCETIVVDSIHICATAHQKLHDLSMASVGCPVERCFAVRAALVYAGSTSKQLLHRRNVACPGSLVKSWRGIIILDRDEHSKCWGRTCTQHGRTDDGHANKLEAAYLPVVLCALCHATLNGASCSPSFGCARAGSRRSPARGQVIKALSVLTLRLGSAEATVPAPRRPLGPALRVKEPGLGGVAVPTCALLEQAVKL